MEYYLDLQQEDTSTLLLTSSTGFLRNIQGAIERLNDGTVSLDYYLQNGKNLQREVEWSDTLMSMFIIGIMNEAVIPPIHLVVLGEDDHTGKFKYFVIDGKQRMTSICRFVNNELRIPCMLNGEIEHLLFKDLPVDKQTSFLFNNFVTKGRLYEFSQKSGYEVDEDQLVKLFKTLNWHGSIDGAKRHLEQLG